MSTDAESHPVTARQVGDLMSHREHLRMTAAGALVIDRYKDAIHDSSPVQQELLAREILGIRNRRDAAGVNDHRAVQAAYWDFTLKNALPLPGAP